jgi:hypothetical protein
LIVTRAVQGIAHIEQPRRASRVTQFIPYRNGEPALAFPPGEQLCVTDIC